MIQIPNKDIIFEFYYNHFALDTWHITFARSSRKSDRSRSTAKTLLQILLIPPKIDSSDNRSPRVSLVCRKDAGRQPGVNGSRKRIDWHQKKRRATGKWNGPLGVRLASNRHRALFAPPAKSFCYGLYGNVTPW